MPCYLIALFFGPTCDSIDVIAKNISFPDLDLGEWVYFGNMGAYTLAAGSCFNGFERPPIYYGIFLYSALS
jgi:ornithine decarboxylase